MLNTPAPFPHVGAAAFLRPHAAACRILRRHDDDTALIALTDQRYPREIASGNRTVPLADLFETAEAALHPVPRAASGRTWREPVATAGPAKPPAVSAAVATTPRKRASRRKAR